MIGRTVVGVASALVAFGAAAVYAPAVPDTTGTVEAIDVAGAPLPIGCPGALVLPVGDVLGGVGSIGADSDDLRVSVFTSGADDPVPVGEGVLSSSAAATQIERVGSGDLAGLAALACRPPSTDAWLVGGSTAIGSSARLVLTNPSDVPSDVTVTLYGPSGPEDQKVHLAVGPQGQTEVRLEGVVSGLPSLVVHVEATAAGVTAVIQDSRLDGFQPAGTDWVVPIERASQRLVIPAVGPSEPNGYAGTAVLRVFAPDGATVNALLFDATGQKAWGAGRDIRLGAGEVTDLEVPSIGDASIILQADAPVIAAAWTRVGRAPAEGLEGDVARDAMWVNGADFSDGRARSVVVPHYSASIVVYAGQATSFSVVDAQSGSVLAAELLAPGATRVIPLAVPSGTLVSVSGDLPWVLVVRDAPGFIAAVQPSDIGAVANTVGVAAGPYVP